MNARAPDPSRKSFAARFAEGDTYGTLLVLIIVAYLLLGVAFAAVYRTLDSVDAHFFAQGAASGVKYLYFSFVVITTLGFGDLTPRTDMGRVIVSLEALLGQIFLVTVVAVLVANLGRAARRSRAIVMDPADDEFDDDE